MSKIITESEVEQVVLDILHEIGYKIIYGPDIAPANAGATLIPSPSPIGRRESYSEVVLVGRLKKAIDNINPNIPQEAKEEALKKVLRFESQSLTVNNQRFHNILVNGVDVEYRLPADKSAQASGRIVGDKVWLFDFSKPKNNEFLAVNQFTVIENNLPARGAQAGYNRRPDVVLFVNGLPLAVIELKNPADENATVKTAFNQFETYKVQIPSLFRFNEILVISDGIEAKSGTISSDWERFLPWKTIDGTEKAPTAIPQIEVLLKGVFDKAILLDLMRHFVVFEKEGGKLIKKIAA